MAKAKREPLNGKDMPALGCELCADTAPGTKGYVWKYKMRGKGIAKYLVPCKCRIAREQAKREVVV